MNSTIPPMRPAIQVIIPMMFPRRGPIMGIIFSNLELSELEQNQEFSQFQSSFLYLQHSNFEFMIDIE